MLFLFIIQLEVYINIEFFKVLLIIKPTLS